MTDEEAVDDIPLTYDRPDLCNKVTLRRSSTGLWKVCSSGQNHENENNNPIKKKPAEIVDKNHQVSDSEERFPNSNSCSGERAKTTSKFGTRKLRCEHTEDDRVQSFVKLGRRTRSSHKDLQTDQSSSRTLKNCEVSDFECHGDVPMGPSKSLGEGGDSRVACSNCSSTSGEDSLLNVSTESLASNCSSLNHKYPTRQKINRHNDGVVK